MLKKNIDTPLAEKFRDQAKIPAFRTAWKEVILPEALDLIKLRLTNMHVEMSMTLEEATNWSPANQSLLVTAELICDLFGRPTRTETTVEINDFIMYFNFGFSLKDRKFEEQSATNFKKLLVDHYGCINDIDHDVQFNICKLLYKKFPKHSEISDHFTEKTKEKPLHRAGKKDLVLPCLQRMMLVIQHMRRMVNMAIKWTGKEGADYQFFSGSTKAGQNVGSNANHHVSDSTLRGCPCGVICGVILRL